MYVQLFRPKGGFKWTPRTPPPYPLRTGLSIRLWYTQGRLIMHTCSQHGVAWDIYIHHSYKKLAYTLSSLKCHFRGVHPWLWDINTTIPAPANDGSDDKIVLFGTVEDLYTILQWLNHLLLMEHCPLIFYQVFSIHIMKHGQTFPMVYAVLPNKQRQTYSRRRVRQKEKRI